MRSGTAGKAKTLPAASGRADELIEGLNARATSVLATLLKPGTRCALLDFPDYSNVGDHAVWLGQRRLLGKLGLKIVYTASQFTFSERAMRAALEGGTILLQGGGNFGDLWPRHQRFRESIIASFPDTRIVQLPQSVLFQHNTNLERAKSIVSRHRDFTLLVRDEQSLAAARQHFGVPTLLCPDLAMGIGPLIPHTAPTVDVLWLYRKDRECAEELPTPLPGGQVSADWIAHDTSAPARGARFVAGKLNHLYPVCGRVVSPQLSLFDAVAWRRLRHGLRTLGQGRIVVTNRLHGHVLCLLLGVQHMVIGDRYGKIRSLYDTWTATSPLVRFLQSPAEAAQLAVHMIAAEH
ncbi:MAG: polysaccharide pyruvyl transferase family protein [Candidatus Eremiobacteraeota bacterium]|nr:polysaccharide pyruvyl transferase family protein [Candidatus Eremiobacteraeota bacterium]